MSFLYNKLGVDLVPVEHILIDNNPEIALCKQIHTVEPILYSIIRVELKIIDKIIVDLNIELILDLNL